MPIVKNIRTVTVHPVIGGRKHKLIAHYGINQIDEQSPYFTVTGEFYEHTGGAYRAEPDYSGMIHDLISEHMPWLRQLIELHLADARTGAPMHAQANAWYLYSIDKHLRRGENVSMPEAYAHLGAGGRAASYLGCDPEVFDRVGDGDPETDQERFAAAVDSLRPLWAQRAELVRKMYRLDPEPQSSAPAYSISLDAESVRDEVQDAYLHGGNPHQHTEQQVQALLALDDATIGEAISAVVDDRFWEAFDAARSDVILGLTSSLEPIEEKD